MRRSIALIVCLLPLAPLAAADIVTLKDLNLKPDLRLGRTVSVEGVLARGGNKLGDRRVLSVGFTAESKPSAPSKPDKKK